MEAIGFLELNSIAKGIEAADFILKTAEVRMLSAKAGVVYPNLWIWDTYY